MTSVRVSFDITLTVDAMPMSLSQPCRKLMACLLVCDSDRANSRRLIGLPSLPLRMPFEPLG